MIKFGRTGTTVDIYVEHGIFYTGTAFHLKIEQSQDYQAQLLLQQLQKNMNAQLERIKQQYYEEGWKTAKAKKEPKRKYFYGGWEK